MSVKSTKRRKRLKRMQPPLKKPCKSCPFMEGGLDLAPGRLNEIKNYLLKGDNHICHSDRRNQRVCRGGRNYQLNIWYQKGEIESPTDEALRKRFKQLGIEPGPHI